MKYNRNVLNNIINLIKGKKILIRSINELLKER